MTTTTVIILMGLLSILAALLFSWLVARIPATHGVDDEGHAAAMIRVSDAIREGAMAFLAREYRYMAVFIFFFGLLVWVLVDTQFQGYPFSAAAFVAGSVISILAGYGGMRGGPR